MTKSLLRTMRPKQWAKNVFIFAGIFFDAKFFRIQALFRTILAFLLFCLASSAIYLLNDLVDIEKDRSHPVKKNRPLASGALNPLTAKGAMLLLLLIAIPTAFWLRPLFGIVVIIYVTLMALYSFVLKNIVIIDVMTVSAGFVLRVWAGTTVIDVTRFSPWLYVCTTLLALFISLNKRRHELNLLADQAINHRSSLQEYSQALLDNMTSIVTSATLVAYSFYTFSAPNLPENHAMMLSIPFVVYGIFRYLYLIHEKHLGGAPEDIILHDKPMLATLVLWALTAAVVLYA
ncbi:MAG: decaprenyl-phosphate phosphoribosyltransferase [Chloroflexota bacterium]|nr:decaprenyl-phosphate phosphoribosyltransferase [Chloroflexota bacterium]